MMETIGVVLRNEVIERRKREFRTRVQLLQETLSSPAQGLKYSCSTFGKRKKYMKNHKNPIEEKVGKAPLTLTRHY